MTTFFEFGMAPQAQEEGFVGTGIEIQTTKAEAEVMFGRQDNIGLVYGGDIGRKGRKAYYLMHKPEQKYRYLVLTIDSDYNEDSCIIETNTNLEGLSADIPALKEVIGDAMVISEDDRVYITDLRKLQVIGI